MVTFEQALAIPLSAVSALATEEIALSEALGRVLAEDVFAEEDQVPYARSAMDGYAVRAADTAKARDGWPVRIPISGKVLAEPGEAALAPGTAMVITTGAPVPHGADAVIPFEDVERTGPLRQGASAASEEISLSRPVAVGESIFPPAEDVRRGERLAEAGEMLRPAALALLAFAGRARVSVHRRPRVGVVCTGNELVDVAATPGHGQIRNSNVFALSALATDCGAETHFSGTAPDHEGALRNMLGLAREHTELVITTGGASRGERDLVKTILTELGAEFRFREVAVRPGKPMGFAMWGGIPVFVLPGNPAAAFVCFQEFVRPVLLKLAGRRETALPVVRAKLRGHLKSKPERTYLVLARLSLSRGGFEVIPLANQCSALVRTSAESNALVLLPPGPATYTTGDIVEVQVLDWDHVPAMPRGAEASVTVSADQMV